MTDTTTNAVPENIRNLCDSEGNPVKIRRGKPNPDWINSKCANCDDGKLLPHGWACSSCGRRGE